MAEQPRPIPRPTLGRILVAAGIGAWLVGRAVGLGSGTGLLPTIPFVGSVTSCVGACLAAIGGSYVRGTQVPGQLEKRRTSLVIVIPALLLFGLVLLGAALFFAQNFEQPTSIGRWFGSTAVLLLSILIVSALFRDVVLRFDESASGGPSSVGER
jgi:hypothetical protein